MRLLLDTCTFLWVITNSQSLSQKAKELFLDEENEVYLSVVSVWEMVIKYQLHRLPLPQSPEQFIPQQCYLHAIIPLPLDQNAVLHLLSLPQLHQDPFDRMLICQAREKNLTILTPDQLLTQYPVQTAW